MGWRNWLGRVAGRVIDTAVGGGCKLVADADDCEELAREFSRPVEGWIQGDDRTPAKPSPGASPEDLIAPVPYRAPRVSEEEAERQEKRSLIQYVETGAVIVLAASAVVTAAARLREK